MTGRTLGAVETLAELLPAAVREAFAVLTQLGDAWFLFVAAALLYWFGDRRRGAFALAAVLGALALTLALKGLFALPRPPAELQVGHASGHGFPSGHAVGATALWGLLAVFVERGTRHRRAAIAAAAVAVVAASRVVIGVHYVADVAVGVAVGLAYLGLLVRATRWEPGRAFALAAGLAVAALATNGLTTDAIATVAGAFGAGAAWVALDSPPAVRVDPASAVAGLGALGALAFAGNGLDVSPVAVFVLNLGVPAGILLLPLAVERAKKVESASPT